MLLSYVVFFALSTLTIASPVAQDSNDPNPDEMLAELSDSSLLDDLNATIVAECSPQSGTTQDNGNIQRRTGTCKPTKEQQTGQTNGGQQLAPETPATRSDNICEGTERPIFLKCNGPVVGGKPDDHIVDLVLHCGPGRFYSLLIRLIATLTVNSTVLSSRSCTILL